MGAKLARPDKLCINVWGDAAIGFTGMDFETAVRERIPILSILLNNFSMAIELPIMQTATAKYRSTDISGNYADMAKAFGGYGERVTDPDEIIPAIKRGIAEDAGRHARPPGVHHREGDHLLHLQVAAGGSAFVLRTLRRTPIRPLERITHICRRRAIARRLLLRHAAQQAPPARPHRRNACKMGVWHGHGCAPVPM